MNYAFFSPVSRYYKNALSGRSRVLCRLDFQLALLLPAYLAKDLFVKSDKTQ